MAMATSKKNAVASGKAATADTKASASPVQQVKEKKNKAKSAPKKVALKTQVIETENNDGAQDTIKVSPKSEGNPDTKAVKSKTKKAKLVRDSFTMPDDEYRGIGELKKACLKAGFEAKKSELLRIGVRLLKRMSPDEIQSELANLTPLKAGRPKKSA